MKASCVTSGEWSSRLRPTLAAVAGGTPWPAPVHSVPVAVTDAERSHPGLQCLVCPETQLPLTLLPVAEAEARIGDRLTARLPDRCTPVGPTENVLLRADGGCAYPVSGGIGVVLGPEQLRPGALGPFTVDLDDRRYAESYHEMAFYNQLADDELATIEGSYSDRALERALRVPEEERSNFPEPHELWLDATYEPIAQWDAYRHLSPLTGSRVLQIGGKGLQALKFLAAGAAEAWLLTPVLNELTFTQELAGRYGLESGLRCVAAVAEEMPFPDGFLDGVFVNGSLHHTVIASAVEECARVLAPGGRFAAVEPWQAPLYRIGTKLLGRREDTRIFGKRVDVACKVLNADRAAPFLACSSLAEARIVHHGALTRYALLGVDKLGLHLQLPTVWKMCRIDDALSSVAPWVRDSGSISVLLATGT